MPKRCFIAMPIRKQGTSEHDHFLGVYLTFFKPPLERAGYEVIRGDFEHRGGAITRQIVMDLSSAELVLCDITSLNPNVLYELGIRHALRKFGTIIVFDRSKDPEHSLPFDLSVYRTIDYESNMAGQVRFHDRLLEAIRASEQQVVGQADNPIHDFLPYLPDNLAIPSDQRSAELQSQIEQLSESLALYRKRFGVIGSSELENDQSPKGRLVNFARLVRAGEHPAEIVNICLAAIDEGDLQRLATSIDKLANMAHFFPSAEQYATISDRLNSKLDSTELARAVIEVGLVNHPDSDVLKTRRFMMLREGSRSERLDTAKQLESELKISDGDWAGAALKFKADQSLFLVYFDLMYGLEEHDKVKVICDRLIEQCGPDSNLLKELGRNVSALDGTEAALPFFREAVMVPEPSDVAAVWYGNELNNIRDYVSAAEAYLLASVLDPRDAGNMIHAAQSIARKIKFAGVTASKRPMPSGIGLAEAVQLLIAAANLSPTGQTASRLKKTLDELDMSVDDFVQASEGISHNAESRISLINRLYSVFKSSVTANIETGKVLQ